MTLQLRRLSAFSTPSASWSTRLRILSMRFPSLMPDLPRILGQRPRKQSIGGSATLRDHSRGYRRLCVSLLDAEPLCRYCRSERRISPATLIDHIVALSLGGSNDRTNLAPACADCNAAKAIVEQRFIARGYEVRDVMLEPELAVWIKRSLA